MTHHTNIRERRLTLLLPFPVLGAAEDYGLTLASGMARRGWEVVVAHNESIDPPTSGFGVRKTAIDTDSLLDIARRLDGRPGVLHVNQVFLPALAVAALRRIHPTVVTAHTPALATRWSLRGRVLHAVARREVARWIVLSERNRQLMMDRHRVASHAISAIHPGLDEHRFRGLPNRAEARAAVGSQPGDTVVGTVGRLVDQKRHDLLIDAVALASRRVDGLKLVIVGDGELIRSVQSRAERLLPGRAILTGHRAGAVGLLAGFDVFAMSSDFEGLPFALLEAMATRRAIVTTDVQGAGEAIRDRKEGLVVPRRDPEALAEAIVTLARDKELADRLSQAARDRFFTDFTADQMIDRTEALYLEVLGRQPCA